MTFVRTARSPISSAMAISLAAMIAGTPSASLAQSEGGLYGRIDGGYSPAGDVDITIAAPVGGNASVKDGFVVSGGVGYAFENGLRIEGEVSHRENGLKPDALNDPGGKARATSLLANAYFDFGGRDSKFNPYIGGGVGAAFSHLQTRNTRPLIPVTIDEKSTDFAYQLMAGVGVGLSENLAVDVGYRYFVVTSIDGQALAPPTPAIPFKADLKQHAATVGLRYKF